MLLREIQVESCEVLLGAPVRQWASRRRCSIPFEGSGLLGGSCLLAEIRAYAQEKRVRLAADCCGSALATRASRDTRGFRPRRLCRSPEDDNIII